MTSGPDVGRILAEEPDPSKRTLYFAALLARESRAADLVVVGGSAIEIQTGGAYTSGDIDLTGPRERLAPVLDRWGFEKTSRVWHRADWRIVVDIPGAEYHGSTERLRTVETPYGPIRVAGVEDLIVSRLISTKYWQLPKDFDQAMLVALQHVGEVDWEYVGTRARDEEVDDLLAEVKKRLPP